MTSITMCWRCAVLQAFVIAFTSEELTLLLYYIEFGTYDNYVDYTLAYAPKVSGLREDLWGCRYFLQLLSTRTRTRILQTTVLYFSCK